ncbi:type IV secretion system protein [Escherichia coli]|uniref:type IV secretion system protein n=1 Tax=Escherichia coli TaxID=562 RepID=UPI00158968D1|nr:type IV secretion system protein [Escherichia coli]
MSVAVFAFINETINNATKVFISSGLQNIISDIKPLVVIGVTLYLMFKGYLQIFGKAEGLLRDTVIHCVVVICITSISLNVVNYTTYLMGGVSAFADGLAGAISSTAGYGSDKNVFNILDDLLVKAIDQANTCFAKMSLWESETWDWIFSAIAVLLSLGAVTLISGVIIIGSKFLLMMLFLLGPLFLCFACFPVTRRFFDSWVGKLMENCLVQVFSISIVTLSVLVIEHFLKSNNFNGDANPIAIAVQITIVSGVMFYILRQIPNLAGSLSGGFASASMTLRDVLDPAKKMHDAIKNSYQHYQRNKDNHGNRNSTGLSSNQIHNGSGHQSRAEMKREQMIKDMIAEQTRKNMSSQN